MKCKLLIMVALCALKITTNAQTKSTSALSFGVNTSSQENKQTNIMGPSNTSTAKSSAFSLGYGYFFKENEKIGLEFNYGTNKTEYQPSLLQEFESYGANISYQKYYPLVKKLFAHAGGNLAYSYGKQIQSSNLKTSFNSNEYSAGAFGGVSWFVSKRIALETNLLSANIVYGESTQKQQNFESITKSNSFNLNTRGLFNNLGFKIYILF